MKILVVDDHSLVREGLRQVLKGLDSNIEVLQAETCNQALAIAPCHGDIDMVLLDFYMPDMNGLEALAIFGNKHPELPIVMLSGQASLHLMRQLLQAGAAGFVTKTSVCDELLRAVRMVLNGDIYLPKEMREFNIAGAEAARPELTGRQERVLRCLQAGLSNRDIADQLYISEETVKTHVAAILRYFEVQNRTQAVVVATRQGYLPLTNA